MAQIQAQVQRSIILYYLAQNKAREILLYSIQWLQTKLWLVLIRYLAC